MIELLFVITSISLVGGCAAALIAWRAVRDNRQRSEARVARLAAIIHDAEPADSNPVAAPHLLEEFTEARQGGPRPLILAGIVALAALLIVVLLQPSLRSRTTDQSQGQIKLQARAPSSIELVSLVHERTPSGDLDLRGEVHNTERGASLENVTAVAMLFDQQGAFLASARAPLEANTVTRGGEATFVIRVPGATEAGRYRVSFRSHDHIIPHVDRRNDREVSR